MAYAAMLAWAILAFSAFHVVSPERSYLIVVATAVFCVALLMLSVYQ